MNTLLKTIDVVLGLPNYLERLLDKFMGEAQVTEPTRRRL